MFLFPLSLFNAFADVLTPKLNLSVEQLIINWKLNLEDMLLYKLRWISYILEQKSNNYQMFPNIHKSSLILPSYC